MEIIPKINNSPKRERDNHRLEHWFFAWNHPTKPIAEEVETSNSWDKRDKH